MNKFFKKFASVLAAAVLALSPVAAMAEETETTTTTVPSSNDEATVVIENIQPLSDGWPTVTAYQIVKADYNSNGVLGYSVTDEGISIADLSSTDGYVYVTADEAETIAGQIKNGTFSNTDGTSSIASYTLSLSESYTAGDGTVYSNVFTGSLPAGSYIVIVSDCEDYVYNPIIVSNYYKDAMDASSLVAGYVDASKGFYTDSTFYYAKYSTTTITKTISSDSDSLTLTEDGGNDVLDAKDVAIGDVVNFTITTQVPYYSDYYTEALFEVSDLMDAGLTLYDNTNKTTVSADKIADIVTVTAYIAKDSSGQGTFEETVLTAGTEYKISAHTFAQGDTYTDSNGDTVTIGTGDEEDSTYLGMTKIVITFNDEWVISNDGVKIIITYSAMLNENATMNEIANINRVSLRYTNEYVTNSEGTSNNPGENDAPDNPEQPNDKDSPVWRLYDIVFVYTFETEDEIGKVAAGGTATATAALSGTLDEGTYYIYDSSSSVSATITVSSDGTVTLSGTVSDGAYTVYPDEDHTTETGVTATVDNGTITYTDALSGAVFTLYTDSDCSTPLTDASGNTVTATTDSDGYVIFTGLDAGTYYMKETIAPSGYTLIDTVYEVVISAAYNTDGTMAFYSVDVYVGSSESAYENDYTFTQSDKSVSQNPLAIANTKLSTLPSTGGIGRYIIMGGSAAVIIAFLFFMTRKKKTA